MSTLIKVLVYIKRKYKTQRETDFFQPPCNSPDKGSPLIRGLGVRGASPKFIPIHRGYIGMQAGRFIETALDCIGALGFPLLSEGLGERQSRFIGPCQGGQIRFLSAARAAVALILNMSQRFYPHVAKTCCTRFSHSSHVAYVRCTDVPIYFFGLRRASCCMGVKFSRNGCNASSAHRSSVNCRPV